MTMRSRHLAKVMTVVGRVMTVPGIGPIISRYDGCGDRRGAAMPPEDAILRQDQRKLPKQMSTGDKNHPRAHPNRATVTFFMQAARVILLRRASWPRRLRDSTTRAAQRLHPNVLAAALANKLARIAWTVLAQERGYEARITRQRLRVETLRVIKGIVDGSS